MFLVQGLIAIGEGVISDLCVLETDRITVIGFVTYIWIVDFPENSHKSFHFLTAEEQALAEVRISEDRGDVKAEDFAWRKCLIHFADPKLYGF